MSLGPILPGRLPNSFAASRLNSQIQTNRREIQKLQDSLSTGQKFQRPGESPAAALTTIILQKRLERNAQYQSNVQTDRSLLSAAENALASINDSVVQARGALQQGIGNNVSEQERLGLADTVASLLQQVVNTANTSFRGRALFGGSQSGGVPFELTGSGAVRYQGDVEQFSSVVSPSVFLPTNIDGQSAFNALTVIEGSDLNAALTLETALSDLHSGAGLTSGSIDVTVDDGSGPITHRVDLSAAKTLNDIKVLIEDAFAVETVNLTVEIDPSTSSGLLITPSSGTVSIADVSGSRVASDLGIAASGATEIIGGDLNPRLTLKTRLEHLNLGTGIGDTAGTGLFITSGDQSQAIDLSAVETIEDLFNTLRLAGLDLEPGFNASGSGLSVSSRLSGVGFSIGENNGENATLLGLRNFGPQTLLSDLNHGLGIERPPGQTLDITRRDGSTISIDLSAAFTVQDVLDSINAVDPGNLVASLSPVGNGISLTDASGTDPLIVTENALSRSLGLNGIEDSGDPSTALQGADVSQRESQGIISLLSSLEGALRRGDNRELTRLGGLLEAESQRFLQVQGEVGNRIQTLDAIDARLQDEEVKLNEDLSNVFDADLAEVLSSLISRQQTLEATYRTASDIFGLSLLQFL